MAYMIMPDRAKCAELGISELAHIPGLWSAKWKLLDEAVDYLIARGISRWSPGIGPRSDYARAKLPAENSMKSYGRDLESFFTYCERFRLDWKKVRYDQLLETYQLSMQTGSYSANGQPLSASTINRRMLTVGDFLTFAAHFDLRDRFEVAQVTIPSHIQSQLQAQIGKQAPLSSRRVGRVRKDPDDLELPTRSEIKGWLDAIYATHVGDYAVTHYLMCRTIIETGLRAEELLMMRANQIPDPNDYSRVKPDAFTVGVEILYGTKGERSVGDPEKSGKPRKIAISRDFLFRLDTYRRGERKRALKTFQSRNPGQPLPKQLFLSPETGTHYSYNRLHEIWTQRSARNRAKTMPFLGWSPHSGRHAWACYEVLERLESELAHIAENARLAGNGDHTPSFSLVDTMARNLVNQFIRPTMGHMSSETTERYLRWLQGQVGRNTHTRNWSAWLDGDVE